MEAIMRYFIYFTCVLSGEYRVCFLGAKRFRYQAEALISAFVSNPELYGPVFKGELDDATYTVVER